MFDRTLCGRKTKIVCTIGPASSEREGLRRLIESGMNVARLNFSHGRQDEHRQVIGCLRDLAEELGEPVAILADLAGPKVRIGTFEADSVELRAGDHFNLTTRAIEGSQREVSVSYPGLPKEVSEGDALMLADGTIQLRVESVDGGDIDCKVVVGGPLSARKGVNVPSGLYGVPILGDKDLRDMRFGVEHGVDFFALSFVRSRDDVLTAKRELERLNADVPVIAKIETQAALKQFDDILEQADGIMIARGDLSIETPFARVPIVQKELIRATNEQAKPVITATQMLFSMITATQPTRAEVADVANAILDGSDAVMLSEETAVGRHPDLAVRTMASIAEQTERAGWRAENDAVVRPLVQNRANAREAVAQAACELAGRLAVDVIATITEEGTTARLVAKFQPSQPVLAITPHPQTFRRLSLVRGVIPLLAQEAKEDAEQQIACAQRAAHERGWKGLQAVVVSRDTVQLGEI